MKHRYDLALFDEGAAGQPAEGAAGSPAGGAQEPAKAAPAAGGYSYAQAEEIASARAQKAERAALASYFKQQGLDEAQVTDAIAAYKAAQKAKAPDVDAITKERDAAVAKVAAYEQKEALAKKGVKAEFAEFVAFKALELMKTDEKLDTFEKAAEKYLKDNPHYAGGAVGGKQPYRVKTSTDGTGGGQGKDKEADAMATLNAALKSAALRRKRI